jgi:hypothetical protein
MNEEIIGHADHGHTRTQLAGVLTNNGYGWPVSICEPAEAHEAGEV